jgi:hypothetical protein
MDGKNFKEYTIAGIGISKGTESFPGLILLIQILIPERNTYRML